MIVNSLKYKRELCQNLSALSLASTDFFFFQGKACTGGKPSHLDS